ncbi:MAG: SRPBCC family protein [Solirubrobacteraceae bacterium]
MDRVQASIVVDSPRERVFDYLQDIANHSQFTDHYLVDWHLTRARSVGTGAGARFRVKAPGNRFGWAGVSIAEAQRPHKIVEVGRGGKGNRIRTLGVYELAPGSGGTTRITFTFQTEPEKMSDKLLESLGGRLWTKRQSAKAMRRLRAILEGGEAGGARVTVAGR